MAAARKPRRQGTRPLRYRRGPSIELVARYNAFENVTPVMGTTTSVSVRSSTVSRCSVGVPGEHISAL